MTSPSDNRPSLGDAQVVEKILLALARECVSCRTAAARKFITLQDANTIEEKEIESRARIFLNRDKTHNVDPAWNTPGAIDSFLAKKLKLEAKGPENIVKAALANFLSDVRQELNLGENPDMPEAQWRPKVQQIVSIYSALLMGVGAQAETPAETPAEFPSPESGTVIITKPFLSDPQTVEKILVQLAAESINCRLALAKKVINDQDVRGIEEKEIEKRAQIFLGHDKFYVSDPNWNVPGIIDSFLAKELSIGIKGTEAVIKAALAKFLAEVRQKVNISAQTTLIETQWKPLIQNILDDYRNAFVGLAPESKAGSSEETLPDYLKTQPPTSGPLPDWMDTQFKKKSEKPAAEVAAGPAGPGKNPRSNPRSNTPWIWIVLPWLLVPVVAFFVITKIKKREQTAQQPQEQKQPSSSAPTPAVKSPDSAVRFYALNKGALEVVSARQGAKVIAPQSFPKIVPKNASSRKIEYLYDAYNSASENRFLIATQLDGVPRSEPNVPIGRDLCLIDDKGTERPLHKSVSRAKFSPDGTKIAYVTTDYLLRVETLDGKMLAEIPRACEPGWKHDGSAVVFLQGPPDIQVNSPEEATILASFDLQKKKVQIISDGLFGNLAPECDPSGKWVLFVSGTHTGLPSFWKVPVNGGKPVQVTNVRMPEGEEWVPTTYQTTIWSPDGRWFLYDFKLDAVEQTWGLEFDKDGNLKRALKLADGLSPQWADGGNFICLKRSSNKIEAVTEKLPES